MSRAFEQKDRLSLAIVTILVTCLALSFGDANIKGSADRFALWQVFAWRSSLALPVFLGLMLVLVPRADWRPKAPGWMVVRVVLLVSMWVFYYLSLPHLQLSVAAAAYYTLPIFMTLFSAILLGERIGLGGWCAAVLGFLGVLIILRPSPEGMNAYAFLPLISAVLYALAMILTRTKCRGDHPIALGFYLTIGFLVAGAGAGLVLTGDSAALWPELDHEDWRILALLAAALVIGSVGAAIAYQNAAPSIIGVFDFAYVGFAVVWGIVLFKEVPDQLTLLGIGTIVVAGVLAVQRSN